MTPRAARLLGLLLLAGVVSLLIIGCQSVQVVQTCEPPKRIIIVGIQARCVDQPSTEPGKAPPSIPVPPSEHPPTPEPAPSLVPAPPLCEEELPGHPVPIGTDRRVADSSCDQTLCLKSERNDIVWIDDGSFQCRSWPIFIKNMPLVDGFACEKEWLLDDPGSIARGCRDFYGRRVKKGQNGWDFADHPLVPGHETWWYFGLCPPKVTTPCPDASNTTLGHDCGDDPNPDGSERGSNGVFGCCKVEAGSLYERDVQAAVDIARVGRLRPDGRVLNEDEFVLAVMNGLRSLGYAVVRGGPEDEVGVKRTNSYSEQYDLLVGHQVVDAEFLPRFPAANHTVNCRPSRF